MIDVRPDQSEKVTYNIADYPVSIHRQTLSAYPNYSAVSHWHEEVEFIAVLSGSMKYSINGKLVVLRKGDGIFVNARQLHYGFSEDQNECIFLCILLHPVLLCPSPYLEETYLTPVLSDRKLPYLFLSHDVKWEQSILNSLCDMYDSMSEDQAELKIQSLFYHIWYLLCRHKQSLEQPVVRNHHLSVLKDMMAYIQAHYREKISLEDIAAAGRVGKTSCCTIFRKFTSQTPISYLTEYRLQKSMELLISSQLTVAEICYDVGFSGASYFTETFRKSFGCSPSEYRKNCCHST